MKHVLFLSIGLLMANTAGHCADANWEKSEASLDYMSGYSVAAWLSQNYDGEDRRAFLKGLREGIGQGELTEEQRQVLEQAKKEWFHDDQRSKESRAAYASGFIYSRPQVVDMGLNRFDFILGYIDTQLNPYPSFLNSQFAMSMLKEHQQATMYKYKKAYARMAAENSRVGSEFLAANAKKPGVVELESGMQYKIIREGRGNKLSPNDALLLNLEVQKVSGEVFYVSKKELAAPLKISLGAMMPAWRDTLVDMKPGSVWELYVPPNLAMGTFGWQDKVLPGETLIYRLELVDVANNND